MEPDLDAIVNEAVEAARGPVSWGVDDCCIFVADIIKKTHHIDIMYGHRDYHSKSEGIRHFRSMGHHDLLDFALAHAERLGLGIVDLSRRPQPLDIGITPGIGGPALSIYFGDHWITRADHGVVVNPHYYAVRAWRIV